MALTDDIAGLFGVDPKHVSGYRSPQEQAALVSRGVTPAVNSAHSRGTPDNPGAIDLGGVPGGDPERVRKMLIDAGHKPTKVIWETGQGPNQGTGPHYHITLDNGTTVAAPANQSTPTPTPSAPIPQQDIFALGNPFSMGPEVTSQGQAVVDRASSLDTATTNMMGVVSGLQVERAKALQTAVDIKDGVRDEIKQQTQNAIDQAQPLWQKREAIQQRKEELSQMNPLKRIIKSTFDPNYNETELDGQDRLAAQHLQLLNQKYSYITQLQDRMGAIAEADYNDHNTILNTKEHDVLQDVDLMQKSYGVAQEVLGTSMQGLQNSMAIISAQHAARIDTLSQLDEGQANAAYSKALASPDGHTIINGIPIGAGELKASVLGFKEQNMNFESRQLALDGGKLQLAGEYETRLISHMTQPQIEKAIADGGSWNGQQLDGGKLTQAYGNLKARQGQIVQDAANASDAGVATSMVQATTSQIQATTARMAGMLGAVPDEQRSLIQTSTLQIKNIVDGGTQAQAQGVGREYWAANLPKLQALYQQQKAMVTQVASRWAGGDKDLQAVGESWLTGQPINSQSAVRGLIIMARGNIPTGTRLSGAAATSLAVAKQAIKEYESAGTGDAFASLLGPAKTVNKATHDREVEALVTERVRSAYIGKVTDDVTMAIPQLAQGISVNGNPHPFTKVAPQDFINSMIQGDADGLKMVGGKLMMKDGDTTRKLAEPEIKRLLAEGADGPIAAKVKLATPNFDYNNFANLVTANQTTAMLTYLDASPSAKLGFRPSQAFADLMRNPDFIGKVNQVARRNDNGTFGNYLASSVAGPGFGDMFSNYANTVQRAYATNQQAVLADQVRTNNSVASDPLVKAGMTLSAMEGFNKPQIQTLLGAIRPLLKPDDPGAANQYTSATTAIAGEDQANRGGYDQIANIIQTHKFDDPQLEILRKKAASQWPNHSAKIQSVVDFLTGK